MNFTINDIKYYFKELYCYDGLKLGYDLFNKALTQWQDENEEKESFLLIEVDNIDRLVLFLLNEYKLKSLIQESNLMILDFYDDKIETKEVIVDDIIMPSENSYLGFSILENFQEPVSSQISIQSIKTIAKSLRKKLKKDLNNIFDLELTTLIKQLGGRLHYVNFDLWNKTEQGSILIHNKRDFDIFVPDFGGVIANRFTIAHELGHYVLHSFVQDRYKLKAARYGDSITESEATIFAINLLVPSEELENFDIEAEELADKYFIPVENILSYRDIIK